MMFAKLIAAVIAALLLVGTPLPAKEAPDNVTQPPAAAEPLALTQAEAETIALKHAGVTAQEVTALRSHYEVDDGIPEWDVDFRIGDWEYDFDIHAETGAIIKWDKEYEPKATKPAVKPAEPAPAAKLTQAEAEAIALNHAGVAADGVTALRSHYEVDDGIPEWDVDFRIGDFEYDYTIHADTGAVLEWDKDYEPAKPAEKPAEPKPTAKLTKDEAKAIALQKAGLAASEVRKVEIELDKEKGILVYEVEFVSGAYEYDFEINAGTGSIIHWDKEIDD